jgi:hypothetical protein
MSEEHLGVDDLLDSQKHPIDILIDGDGFRVRYADGTLSRLLSVNEMMDVLPALAEPQE